MPGNLVTKNNELINASYRLSLSEARVILYGISLINPMAKDFPLEYEIRIEKYSELFGLKNNKNLYGEIKEAVMNKFWEREFTIRVGELANCRLRWLTGITYSDNKGYLKIHINPLLKPLLHQLSGNFTSYNLDKIALFKNIYSIRIYEVAIMNLNKSKSNKYTLKTTIQDLKELLDLTEKYIKFSNFKACVLNTSMKEINKHSDIKLSYKVIKLGRTPHEIEFCFLRKKPKNKPLGKNELSPPILEKVKWMAEGAGTNWAVSELEKQFWAFANSKGRPKDIENAFLGFAKKKISLPA